MKDDTIHNYAKDKKLNPGLAGATPDFRFSYLWENKLEERQLRTHTNLYQSCKANSNWSLGEDHLGISACLEAAPAI